MGKPSSSVQAPVSGNIIRQLSPLVFWLLIVLGLLLITASAEATNQKPVANAGQDRTVFNSPVILDGSQSTDNDGQIKKYLWQQIKGKKVALSNPKTAIASFSLPAAPVELIFKLTVTDNKGAKASDSVKIAVGDDPIPVCTPPQIFESGRCVTPPPVCIAPKVLQNDVCVAPAPVCVAPQVLKDGHCVIEQSCAFPKIVVDSVCVEQTALSPINDTGITGCSDTSMGEIRFNCPLSTYPGQDGEFGRDVVYRDERDGHAGFSFTKLSTTGTELSADAKDWACVRDNVTGLIWEEKTDDGGLRDKDLIYTHDTNTANAAGFVAAVNAQGLCGGKDWRLPAANELQGIADYSVPYPQTTIDVNFFPHTLNSAYWTAESYAKDSNAAWVVYFNDGRVFDDNRAQRYPLRLVRNGKLPASSFSAAADDEEFSDPQTGLIWRRCPEGMNWKNNSCSGQALHFTWYEWLQLTDAQNRETGKGWRLPNVKELSSLLDRRGFNQAVDAAKLPGIPNAQFWSATPYSFDEFYAWMVHFYDGAAYYSYLEDFGAAWLVRDPR